MLSPESIIGNMVVEDPSLARVFESLEIDYFCNGRRPLAGALNEAGVSFEQFLAECRVAREAPAGPPKELWRDAPMRALIRHILSSHHAYLHREMPALERWAACHPSSGGMALQSLWEVLYRLRLEMEVHIRKEETILFPAIEEMETAVASGARLRTSPFGSASNFSLVLEREHRQCAALLHQIRVLIHNPPSPPEAPEELPGILQRLRALVEDTHYHIHLENNILFPRAIELDRAKEARHDEADILRSGGSGQIASSGRNWERRGRLQAPLPV